jgi:hypothetical protein
VELHCLRIIIRRLLGQILHCTTETLNVVDEALVWGSCSILLPSYLSTDEESLAMSVGLEEFVDPHVITNIEWKMLISDDLL